MRPPSRHKELPQGLDLPPADQEDDIPSLDEDSDSLLEFEIGLQNASAKRQTKKQGESDANDKRSPPRKTFQPFMPLSGPQGLNRDSSEEDEEAQCYESEI